MALLFDLLIYVQHLFIIISCWICLSIKTEPVCICGSLSSKFLSSLNLNHILSLCPVTVTRPSVCDFQSTSNLVHLNRLWDPLSLLLLLDLGYQSAQQLWQHIYIVAISEPFTPIWQMKNPLSLIQLVPTLDGNSITFPSWRNQLLNVLTIQRVLNIVNKSLPFSMWNYSLVRKSLERDESLKGCLSGSKKNKK
jgi:hypothetical protein